VSQRDWIGQYSLSHQHPINRVLHTFGIPMIAGSFLLLPVALLWRGMLWVSAALFVVGWALQFIGHYVEKKPPEFLSDPRFLFVGLRWWFAKMRGRA
jgi:uncharacterized membrane protein YGL010W